MEFFDNFFKIQDDTFMSIVCNQVLNPNSSYTNKSFDEYCQLWFTESLYHCSKVLTESKSSLRKFFYFQIVTFNFIWNFFFSDELNPDSRLGKRITHFEPSFLTETDCDQFLNEIAQDYINIAPKYVTNLYYMHYVNITHSIFSFMTCIVIVFKIIRFLWKKKIGKRKIFKYWDEEQMFLKNMFYEKKVKAILNNTLNKNIYQYYHLKAPTINKLQLSKTNINLQIQKTKLKDAFIVLFKSLPINRDCDTDATFTERDKMFNEYSESRIFKYIDGSKKCKFLIEFDVDVTDDYIEENEAVFKEIISEKTSAQSSNTSLNVKTTESKVQEPKIQLHSNDQEYCSSLSPENSIYFNLSQENSFHISIDSESSEHQIWVPDRKMIKLEFPLETDNIFLRKPFKQELATISEHVFHHDGSFDSLLHQHQSRRSWSDHGGFSASICQYLEHNTSSLFKEYIEKHINPLISKPKRRKKCLTYKFRKFQQRIIVTIDSVPSEKGRSRRYNEILKSRAIEPNTAIVNTKLRTLYSPNKKNTMKNAHFKKDNEMYTQTIKKNNLRTINSKVIEDKLNSTVSAPFIQKGECQPKKRNGTQRSRRWKL